MPHPLVRPSWSVATAALAAALVVGWTQPARADVGPMATDLPGGAQQTQPPARMPLPFVDRMSGGFTPVTLIDDGREPSRMETGARGGTATPTVPLDERPEAVRTARDVAAWFGASPIVAAEADSPPRAFGFDDSTDASSDDRSSTPTPSPTSPAQEPQESTHEEPPQPTSDETDNGTPWWMLLVGLGLALPLGAGTAVTMVNERTRARYDR